jgi:hypothetical protein
MKQSRASLGAAVDPDRIPRQMKQLSCEHVMLWHFKNDPDKLDGWFRGFPEITSHFVGEPWIVEQDRVELVPFQFSGHRYLCWFADIVHEVGGDATELQMYADAWADGYVPHRQSRLIKFLRADVHTVDEMYDPSKWQLNNPRDIFSFGEFLVEAVWIHAQYFEGIKQYFFKPSNLSLLKFYERILSAWNGVISEHGFCRIHVIEGNDGGFIGYER